MHYKNSIYCLLLLLFASCGKKYIMMPNVKGKIYSKKDNKPIVGIGIFVSKYAINNTDTVRTDHNGSFFYDGFFVDDYSDVRSMSTMVQHVFILNNNKNYKYIDVKNIIIKVIIIKKTQLIWELFILKT